MERTKSNADLKRERLNDLRKYHQPYFNEAGIANAQYLLKTDFTSIQNEFVIGVFESEIRTGQDLYIEYADLNNVLKYKDRALYKWRHNPHYEEEYVHIDKDLGNNTVSRRYLIPISELEIVTPHQQPEEKKEEKETIVINPIESEKVNPVNSAFILSNENLDLPYDQMTIRDYAAIHLRTPCSNKVWLNEIINSL